MEKVALVTGASRGLGRGIARALAAEGMTIYLTGRTEAGLEAAAAEIEAAGGKPRPVRCDHGDDADVAALMDRIRKEAGSLSLLVNNAAAVHPEELGKPGPFWTKGVQLADMITVGLRSSYVASYHAAPLMIETGAALIVNISFYGAVSYFHGPAYGAAKAGTDKMSYDMSVDFDGTDVSVVSFWPGYIMTDELKAVPAEFLPEDIQQILPDFETPELSGRVISALLADERRMSLSGKALIGARLADDYGLNDADGKRPRIWTGELGKPVDYPVFG